MPAPVVGAVAGLIALLVNMIRTMLMIKAGVIVAKILLFFGIQIVTDRYVIDPLLDFVRGMIDTGPAGGIGAALVGWAGVLKFDQALSMILSAYATAASIRSLRVGFGLATPGG